MASGNSQGNNVAYFIGELRHQRPEDKAVIDGIRIVFPNQSDRGTHVNISGAGVVASAPNKENAIKFIEYLTSDEAQRIFAEGNNEYPVIGEATGPISTLGSFNEDQISASILGIKQKEAVELMTKQDGYSRQLLTHRCYQADVILFEPLQIVLTNLGGWSGFFGCNYFDRCWKTLSY